MAQEPSAREIDDSYRVRQARQEEARLTMLRADVDAILKHQERQEQIQEAFVKRSDDQQTAIMAKIEQAITEAGTAKQMIAQHVQQVTDRQEYERLETLETWRRNLERDGYAAKGAESADERRDRKTLEHRETLFEVIRIVGTIGGIWAALQIHPHF